MAPDVGAYAQLPWYCSHSGDLYKVMLVYKEASPKLHNGQTFLKYRMQSKEAFL